ncbi:MAG: TetR/AcrR family transcriptional regulator [Bifidobacterium pseudocatenulatum]
MTPRKAVRAKGYERTTIQDILDELEDLSKGAIYHHFKNKEAMLYALVDSDNERLLPQANQEDGSRNGLQKLRNSLMMQITDAEHMTLMRDAFLLNDPKILAENLRIWRTDSTKIAYDFIQEGLKDGSITTEYPQEAAELFHCCSITG